jgi:hypothetical protein
VNPAFRAGLAQILRSVAEWIGDTANAPEGYR